MSKPWWALLLFSFSSVDAFAVESMRISIGTSLGTVEIIGKALRWRTDIDDSVFEELQLDRVTVATKNHRLSFASHQLEGNAVRISSADDHLTVNQIQVRGEVVVHLSPSGLQFINVLPMEEYLVSVVSSEMSADFPAEALKAQAVTARTFALKKKSQSYSRAYYLGSSVLSQVYRGLEHQNAAAKGAVEATSGQVLTYQLEPIEAFFHSSCGGKTEISGAAFHLDLPYLKSVDCPCPQVQKTHWDLRLSSKDWPGLKIVRYTATHRVQTLGYGAGKTIDATEFRKRVGYDKLKSLVFDVEAPNPRQILLKGRGYGHGVGLCQWGARVLAEQGKSYREILLHYFSGVELQQMY